MKSHHPRLSEGDLMVLTRGLLALVRLVQINNFNTDQFSVIP